MWIDAVLQRNATSNLNWISRVSAFNGDTHAQTLPETRTETGEVDLKRENAA